MNNQSPTDPVLAHVEPVPGGLYGDQPYEAALSDLRAAVAEVSAALRDADWTTAKQLTRYQRELNGPSSSCVPVTPTPSSAPMPWPGPFASPSPANPREPNDAGQLPLEENRRIFREHSTAAPRSAARSP